MVWKHASTLLVLAALAGVASAIRAATPAPDIPDTPAGRALSEWLGAFNAGDPARVESFRQRYSWGVSADGALQWQAEVGGYDLLAVYTNDKTLILFRVRTRADGSEEFGRIRLASIDPPVIAQLSSHRIPTGARFTPLRLDDTVRGKIVDAVARLLVESYVDPAIGQRMAADLRHREARHEYRALTDGRDFVVQLTEDLRRVSHDKHLEVRFSYVALPALAAEPVDDESKRLAAVNCGFVKAEHLRPNVGYVKFDGFENAKLCGPTATAAMNFVADGDALILDLRDNHGGGGGMPEYVASYLFAERTHLDDLYSRATGSTTEVWTTPDVPGRKFVGRPVYVLVSNGTFSAAEYLANVLRNLRGATLVGETTGGGAHTTDSRRIDAHFTLRLPTGRPLTRTDWEGTGLEPDVRVPAGAALETALKLASGPNH